MFLSEGLSNKVEVLHILSLLKDTLSLFPSKNVKSLCEVVLRLMTLTDLVSVWYISVKKFSVRLT